MRLHKSYSNAPLEKAALLVMPSSPFASSSATFYRDELHRAMKEQFFGIASFTLCSSSAFDATARVELLEKVEVDVILSLRGYQVLATTPGGYAGADPNAFFETLDLLLQHISPLYATRRAEALFDRLSR